MSSHRRLVRYGTPIAVVVLGIAWAAVDTNQVGNTAGTVLIAVGLIAFMTIVGRDIGMGESTGRVPRVDEHERPLGRAGERPSGRPDAPATSNGRSADGARRLQRDDSPPSSPS